MTASPVASGSEPTATLRRLWQGLEQVMDHAELAKRRQEHRAALDLLVGAGAWAPSLVDQLQLAFEHATDHVERSLSFCYIAFPPEYMPRQDLLQQARLLQEVSAGVDPATVTQAQAAIARDLAFLGVGQVPPDMLAFLKTGALDLEPDVLEAARLLAELLHG